MSFLYKTFFAIFWNHIDWLLSIIIINNEISSIYSKYHDYHKILRNILLCLFGMSSPGESLNSNNLQIFLEKLRFFLRIQNMIFYNIINYYSQLDIWNIWNAKFINNHILFVQKLVLISISKKNISIALIIVYTIKNIGFNLKIQKWFL